MIRVHSTKHETSTKKSKKLTYIHWAWLSKWIIKTEDMRNFEERSNSNIEKNHWPSFDIKNEIISAYYAGDIRIN